MAITSIPALTDNSGTGSSAANASALTDNSSTGSSAGNASALTDNSGTASSTAGTSGLDDSSDTGSSTGATGLISNPGVGSGLPLKTLLASLRTNLENNLTVIKNREDGVNAKITAYGTIKSAMSSLQTALEKLSSTSDDDAFAALGATTSSTAFKATTTQGAEPGSYSVQVSGLATAQALHSTDSVTSKTDKLASGDSTLTFTFKDGSTKTVNLSGNVSLSSLVDSINGANAGVNASIIGDSANGYYLALTASKTGGQAAVTGIKFSDTGLDGKFGMSAADSNDSHMTVTAAGSDASLTINGIQVTSPSNTVEDAINGVTLTLTGTNSAPETLTVSRDTSSTLSAIQEFVKAYNGVLTTIDKATAFDTSTETKSALTGDYNTARISNTLARALQTYIPSNGSIQSLADIGITTDHSTGQLQIDQDQLKKTLDADPAAVQELFQSKTGGAASGVATGMSSAIENMLGTNGVFGTEDDSLNAQLQHLRDNYKKEQTRINDQMAIYEQQFTALDTLVSKLSSVSNYLTQQIGVLNGTTNG